MTYPRFRVYDPLRAEWATPHPAAIPMTDSTNAAALHACESDAVLHSRQIIGPARPWLVMQPADAVVDGEQA